MPAGASFDDRVAWHVQHARRCGCRRMPASITAELDRRRAAPALIAKYFAGVPPFARRRLRAMRLAVRAAAPHSFDGFSYRMPCVTQNGSPVVWYAAFTSHTSLFPMTDRIRRANAKALRGLETSKGTIRFPLDRPMPVALIKRLVRARLAELG